MQHRPTRRHAGPGAFHPRAVPFGYHPAENDGDNTLLQTHQRRLISLVPSSLSICTYLKKERKKTLCNFLLLPAPQLNIHRQSAMFSPLSDGLTLRVARAGGVTQRTHRKTRLSFYRKFARRRRSFRRDAVKRMHATGIQRERLVPKSLPMQ